MEIWKNGSLKKWVSENEKGQINAAGFTLSSWDII
jgi:hypothetical protein